MGWLMKLVKTGNFFVKTTQNNDVTCCVFHVYILLPIDSNAFDQIINHTDIQER